MIWLRKKTEKQDVIADNKRSTANVEPITPEKTWIEKVREKYGNETLKFGWDDEKSLLFFDDSRVFFWNGKDYLYSSIVNCKLEPFHKTLSTGNNQAVSITKTDTGSMIGRAIVGTLIWGPVVGGIAGAASAKKTTITTMPDVPKTIIDYYLFTISMDNGLNVIRKFHDDNLALTAFEKVKSIINQNISTQAKQSTKESVSENVSKDSIIEGLSSLIQMKEKGLLTDEEFAKAKMKLLS